jgi:hypothetical protein
MATPTSESLGKTAARGSALRQRPQQITGSLRRLTCAAAPRSYMCKYVRLGECTTRRIASHRSLLSPGPCWLARDATRRGPSSFSVPASCWT